MADLSDLQAAQTVKIAGAPSSGIEDNFMDVDSSGRVTAKLNDAAGNALTSTNVSSKQRLDVNSSITSPAGSAAGLYAFLTAYGTLRISGEGSALFTESFDGSVIDTTSRWSSPVVAGTGTVTQGSGTLTLSTSTTASNAAAISSQANFRAQGLNFITFGVAIKLETTAIQSNTHRFWGIGTPGSPFVATTPLTDAIGFEIDTSSNLNAVVWSGGTKTTSISLNASKPIDGAYHKYAVVIRGDLIVWYLDSIEVPIASANFPTPNVSTLPVRFHMVNGTSGPASPPTFQIAAVGLSDTGNNNIGISDGTYPWRKATVDVNGGVWSTPVDGGKATYSASIQGLAVAGSPTDVFTITGSATKTIRITKIEIIGTQNGLGSQTTDVLLIKRSTANSAGTSTTRTAVPHDSQDAAASAVVRSYTTNPTLGTVVGTIRNQKVFLPNAGNPIVPIIWELGVRPSKCIVLRGTGEVLAINLNGVSLNTTSFDISIEWTEE